MWTALVGTAKWGREFSDSAEDERVRSLEEMWALGWAEDSEGVVGREWGGWVD